MPDFCASSGVISQPPPTVDDEQQQLLREAPTARSPKAVIDGVSSSSSRMHICASMLDGSISTAIAARGWRALRAQVVAQVARVRRSYSERTILTVDGSTPRSTDAIGGASSRSPAPRRVVVDVHLGVGGGGGAARRPTDARAASASTARARARRRA